MAASDAARFDAFDVMVVPFPYADRLAEKRRPALVVSNRKLAVHGVVWVAMITSAENERWSSDVAITDLTRAGLPAPSVVRPAKIACLDPNRIDRRVGRLDRARRVTWLRSCGDFWGDKQAGLDGAKAGIGVDAQGPSLGFASFNPGYEVGRVGRVKSSDRPHRVGITLHDFAHAAKPCGVMPTLHAALNAA